MAKDLNQVTLIGRLVKNPEIKYTTSGQPVAKFAIACNESYMQNNERKDVTSFFDIVVWGNQAVNCEKYLKKGNQAAISGKLRQNRWTDQATGKNLSKIEIIADSVQFLTAPSGSGQTQGQTVESPFVTAPQNNFQKPVQQQPVNTANKNPGNQGSFNPNPWNDNTNQNSGNNNADSGYDDSFSAPFEPQDDIPF